MLNRSKLILLNVKKNKKNKINTKSVEKNIINDFKINYDELEKLRNPSKGQIFIHFIDDKHFSLFRFNGKEWLEIKE